MVSVLGLTLAALAASGAGSAPRAQDPACERLLPERRSATAAGPLSPEDLVDLVDIGPVDPEPHGARLFTLSPNGRLAAFHVQRADPARNRYCLGVIVVDTASGKTVVVDRGGELIRVTFDFRGKAAFPTGIGVVVIPRWFPDGDALAFLRRDGGASQVWRAAADGSDSRALTHGIDDIEDFRIGADGTTMLFATRPGLRAARATIAREGHAGFHYDDRYSPMSSSRPFPVSPIPLAYFAQDLATGAVRPATLDEQARFVEPDPREAIWTRARGPGGRIAEIDTADADAGAVFGHGRLRVTRNGEAPLVCADAACRNASRPLWTADGRRVRFIAREGWARASTAIYEWLPGSSAPRRLLLTDDVLIDCAPQADDLICLREGSTMPRRLERIRLATGRRTTLFDPNPGFAAHRLGTVERLHLRNATGLESVADLVLPVDYQAGKRYPLIVVQYDTRGFLRGGTGDEYPIQAFAARGFAVLSMSRPQSPGRARGAADTGAIEHANLAGFTDRRSALSTVETGVRLLIARGVADPGRIGITGFSNGATTATFALINSKMFAAAAMSNCCFDTTLATRVGPSAARFFTEIGYPRLIDRDVAFWDAISLSRNARRIDTPILLQVADDEMMSALESYTALREAGQPVDMYVFPDEHHVKWQPAHRLAVYRRALDWFDYWLRGVRSDDPDRRRELDHWDSLRSPAQKDR